MDLIALDLERILIPHQLETQIKAVSSVMVDLYKSSIMSSPGDTIGLYRENAIAIEGEARDPFGGNVYYVTMQMTFLIPEFARKERNLHCDVVHVTTKWVSRMVRNVCTWMQQQ